MKIWFVTVGEPLPTEERDRAYRTGILSKKLNARGHEVTWWSTSFDHIRKRHRFSENKEIDLIDGRKLRLIKGPGYRRNISIMRVIDHHIVARAFAKMSSDAPVPDIIVCSYPTIELSWEVYLFCQRNNVPFIVDVRDLWPDIYVSALPPWIYGVSRPIFYYWNRMATTVFNKCTVLIGVSEKYLVWALAKGRRSRQLKDQAIPLGYPSNILTSGDSRIDDGDLHLLGIDTTRLLFLFVGTFGSTYDLSMPIRAIREFDDEILDRVQFVFCGDGEQGERWRKLAIGQDHVVFTGWLEEERLRKVMQAADVGLAAYAAGAPQGIPNKIIEFMAAGLPVLSSLEGETKELLRTTDTGLTYQATDTRDFSNVVLKMIDPVARRRMSDNSRTTFEANFRADVVYDKYADLIENVAGLA